MGEVLRDIQMVDQAVDQAASLEDTKEVSHLVGHLVDQVEDMVASLEDTKEAAHLVDFQDHDQPALSLLAVEVLVDTPREVPLDFLLGGIQVEVHLGADLVGTPVEAHQEVIQMVGLVDTPVVDTQAAAPLVDQVEVIPTKVDIVAGENSNILIDNGLS